LAPAVNYIKRDMKHLLDTLNGKNNLLLKYFEKNMKLLVVGSVAFDAIETPFGKTDKILGGAATYIGITSSILGVKSGIVSVVGGDFPRNILICSQTESKYRRN
jgi:hypothetical protein